MKNNTDHRRFSVLILFVSVTVLLGWAIVGQDSDNQPKRSVQPETMALVPMMQQLLTDMQQVDRGIYTEDFTLIENASGKISDHPAMTADDKKLVKKTLGEEMQKFVDFDMVVHHHADSMRMAAAEQNMQKVLKHYRITQQGCVDCHSNYREPISSARLEN